MLATIAADDAVALPGDGPIAVGALPFDPACTGTLVIPARSSVSRTTARAG